VVKIKKYDVLRAVLETNHPDIKPQSMAVLSRRLGAPKVRISSLLQRLKNQDMVFLADGKRWHLTEIGRRVFDE